MGKHVRPFLAVATQFTNSGCNYLAFILLSRHLNSDDFIGFSTAVGLNLLAFAVAESGISYVAPREIGEPGSCANRLVVAFLSISVCLYCLGLLTGFAVWNFFSVDDLNGKWVVSYGLFFLPTVLLPAWFLNRRLRLGLVLLYIPCRLLLIGHLLVLPGAIGLAQIGIAGAILALVWFMPLGGNVWGIVKISLGDLTFALRKLKVVMLAKSVSHAAYGAVPMIIGIVLGNGAAASYVTGERLKALYSTVFQPIVLALYISICNRVGSAVKVGRMVTLLLLGNLCVFSVAYWNLSDFSTLIFYDKLGRDSGREFYLIAAAISVCSTIILYFRIFLSRAYKEYAKSTVLQSTVLMIGMFLLIFVVDFPPWLLLLIAEFILLTSLVSIVIRSRGGVRNGAIQ